MGKVEIKNERLKQYLEYEFDKNEGENILKAELENINQVTIFGKSISGKTIYNGLSDLLYFDNLTSCMIKDVVIKDEDVEIINKLEKLEDLHFDNCVFQNKVKKINCNINKLILSFCTNLNINLFDSQEELEYLRVTSGERIELEGLESFNNIKELYLQSIEIKDIGFVNELEKLTYLNLNGSSIKKNKKCINKINAKVEYKKDNFPI